MSDFQTLADVLLAHAPALTLAIGTIVAIGVIVVIVMLLRPRKPRPDPVAEQRMADLNARVQSHGRAARQGAIAIATDGARAA